MPRQRDDQMLRTIGERVRALRDRAGLTQAQLADAAGIEAVTLSRYECGARSPSVSTLGRIARALGVPVSDVVDDGRSLPPPVRRPAEEAALRVLARFDDARLNLAVRLLGTLEAWPGE